MSKRTLKRDSSQLIDELWDQIDNLQGHCKIFAQGTFTIYKGMSVTLRMILVGSSGDDALVEAVLPNALFFPLNIIPTGKITSGIITPCEIVVTNDQGGELHYAAGGTMPFLGIEGGGVVLSKIAPVGGDTRRRTKVKNMLNVMGNRLPLDAWLAQPFLRREWSIRSFIKCIAHKDGGAHVNASLQLEVMEHFGNIHSHLTERISSYVGAEIASQLRQAYPKHLRRVR